MDFNEIIKHIGNFAWGPVSITLLVGTGLYLTIRTGFIQIRAFKHSLELITGKYDSPKAKGEITHFQALSTALSATIGTGNIAGVATAIASGGPGAIFWMWVTALVGMATKFTCCSLAVMFRKENPDGTISGGPMYYLEYGLKQKWLGQAFALFALIASFGIGNMVQANSIAEPLLHTFAIPKWVTGVVMAILAGLVIIGGIKRIANFSSFIVPFMTIGYVSVSLIIIFLHIENIPKIFAMIFESAFSPVAATGGFAGATVAEVIRYGVARGAFSNEAGIGSAPMAHAPAKTNFPVREGIVAMLGPFLDTIIICSMTAFVILNSGLWNSGQTGTVLTSAAYSQGIGTLGSMTVIFGVVFFAYSTIIAWSYYGDRTAQYLFGNRAIKFYHWIYVIFIVVGATIQLETVWNLSDAMNGLMILPNLIGVIFLSSIVVREKKRYYQEKLFLIKE